MGTAGYMSPEQAEGNTKLVGEPADRGSSVIDGSGDGQGPGKASFFGKEVTARSIAFVIDASGSMEGARFHRARNELASSLSALEANQRFFVVFDTDQTYPQFYTNNIISLNADSHLLTTFRQSDAFAASFRTRPPPVFTSILQVGFQDVVGCLERSRQLIPRCHDDGLVRLEIGDSLDCSATR